TLPIATAVGPARIVRSSPFPDCSAARANRLFFTTWYSIPRGRSRRRSSWSSPTFSPRYSVTTSETVPPSSPARPSTFFHFPATPPPLRLTLGPVLTFATQLPSSYSERLQS